MPVYASDTEFLDHDDAEGTDVFSLPVRHTSTAALISSKDHILPDQLVVTEVWFDVPLNYDDHEGPKVRLFGRIANKRERPIVPSQDDAKTTFKDLPWMVYLEGGPGFGNSQPQDVPLTRFALGRGYQVLYLDYRGTGLSTPVTSETLALQGGPQQQADYLKLFRADNVVRDLEAVRRLLYEDIAPEKQSWSLFCQSWGGFVALTYLSKFGHSLEEVFISGGLAPIGKSPDEVYRATWQKVLERNNAYYAKYHEDVSRVHDIVRHIRQKGPIALPSGGTLTTRRFLGVGMSFGAHGGLDRVHALVLRMHADLQQFGFFTRPSLSSLEQFVALDVTPIYAILHESIYCGKGVASKWAAYRVGKEMAQFSWLAAQTEEPRPPSPSKAEPAAEMGGVRPLFFSGETIFPFNFDDCAELARMKEAADILAHFSDWPDKLYDEKALARNRVPVYAASYIDDMYVEIGLARQTAKKVRGIKVWETNSLYHNAIRARSDEVFQQLFRMRDDVMD